MKIYGSKTLAIRVMNDGSLRFDYKVNDDVSCCFSLLCEVGQKWQLPFEQLMKKHGLKLAPTPMELPASPWYADTLA